MDPFEWSSLATDALLGAHEFFYRRVGELHKALADSTWIIEYDHAVDDATAFAKRWIARLVCAPEQGRSRHKKDFAICRDDDPEYYESKIKT